jgi:non-specific serine/threonine protein kinase
MVPDDHEDDKTRTHAALTQGISVGHYRIIEKIGAGGMGEVYLAEDTHLKRQVALKFLPPHLCQDEDCRARFKREAQAAANLDHPNIVTIHEVSEYQGRPFFAMQHVEGGALRDLIKEEELQMEKVISLAIQMCEGLEKAHEAGIIHRDIKPSNIVIDSDGRPKLLDFGLAAIQGTDKLTKTGSTLGTTGYMSPEQIQVKEVDQRSDLFSFGVMLYQMIAGRLPFKGDTEAATLNSVLNDIPEPLSRYKSGVTGDLQRIVTKLLEKNPELRYQSAAGVISDLKRLSVGADLTDRSRKDWWNRYVVVGAAVIILVIAGYWLVSQFDSDQIEEPVSERKMLAVLPFENLGAPDDEYFADGITDEITSRLASVHALGVISRTSAFAYKSTTKTLPQIAEELGVDYILEGTIRWDKSRDVNRVRVTPQLINVSDDTHLWADSYEMELKDIFEVQADIASKIADALDVSLLDSEQRSIMNKPTDNLTAYDYYLRGREYYEQEKNVELAIQMFERAVEADSTFYQAHSMLARLHGFSYFNYFDRSDLRLNKAKEAAERAFRFANGKPEGFFAMGYFHYYGSRNYDRALEQFELALEKQPNSSDVLSAMAYVQRRQGKWEEAKTNLAKSLQINPHSENGFFEMTALLWSMRQYVELEIVLDRALSLFPDEAEFLVNESYLILVKGGDTSEVRKSVDQTILSDQSDQAGFWLEDLDMLFRDYDSALERRATPGDHWLADSGEFYLSKADAYRFSGRDSMSIIYYDSARVVAEGRLATGSPVAFCHLDLGVAYAGLGRKEDAIREGKRAVELLPVTKDTFYGPTILSELASIYTMVGEYDLAIDQLDYSLSIPAGVHLWELRMYPKWDPLRDHPRFQALLEKHDK